MRTKRVLAWLAALAVMGSGALAQGAEESGPHQNLKGLTFCVSFTPVTVSGTGGFGYNVALDFNSVPEAVARRIIDKVAVTVWSKLSSAKIPFEFDLTCALARGEIDISILGLDLGSRYVYTVQVGVKDWTSHAWPVTIWDQKLLSSPKGGTPSSELPDHIADGVSELLDELIADWRKVNGAP